MKLGTNDISTVKLGTNQVQKVYLGTNEVWSSFTPDSDAAAFFDRVTTAGGSLSMTEKVAVNTLVLQMKTDGIWSKMKAIYPMVGASAAACAQNLKSSSFTGSFTSGWTFASTGVTANGISAYLNSNLTPSGNLSQNSTHLSVYINNNTTGNFAEMGCSSSGTQLALIPNYGTLGDISRIYTPSYPGNLSQSNTDGFFIASRIISSEYKVYRNATNYRTTSVTSTTPPTTNISIGAWQDIGLYSTRRIALSSIGDGLTNTEVSDFYDAVQAFQTTLSRNV